MGLIINPRGSGGAGKTELVRRILEDYGWDGRGKIVPLRRQGRGPPLGYRLEHPHAGHPLVVIGHYEKASGGCDTITAAHGGLDEIFRLADASAHAGYDVLLEGSAWSTEERRSAVLAAKHGMHVLLLVTPPEHATRNLAARRRARKASWPHIARAVSAQRAAVHAACEKLRGVAVVEEWEFDGALRRARDLLGLWHAVEPAPAVRPVVSRLVHAKICRPVATVPDHYRQAPSPSGADAASVTGPRARECEKPAGSVRRQSERVPGRGWAEASPGLPGLAPARRRKRWGIRLQGRRLSLPVSARAAAGRGGVGQRL